MVIPITLAINFFVMRLAGFSLNIFSLGGMVMAIGIMLDASTIVLENITRLRRAHSKEPTGRQGVATVGQTNLLDACERYSRRMK